MAQQKKQTEFYDVPEEPVSEGVIMEGVLSHYVSPKTAISYAENMHNDTAGLMTTRRGLKVTGTAPAARAKNCVMWADSTTPSTAYIVWQEGTTFKVQDILGTAGVTSYATRFGPNKAHFDTTGGYVFMASSEAGIQPRYIVNNIVTAPAVLPNTHFPDVDLISVGFGGRMWAADSKSASTRLYYSDILVSPLYNTTSANPPLNILIPAQAGDRITGFAKTNNILFVFTHNNIFRVYAGGSSDSVPVANVGTFSQDAIVKTKLGYFFYHPSGVFKIAESGQPQEVSVKIRDIIQQIPDANQSDVFGWADDDHAYWSIGKLPSRSTTNNYIIRYTLSTQVWTIYAVSSVSGALVPTCAASNNFSDTAITSDDIYPSSIVFADDTTNFYKGTFNVFLPENINSDVNNDFGVSPIYVEYQTNWWTFDQIGVPETHEKRANGLFVPSENGAGLKVAYQIDTDKPNVWREIGVLGTNYITAFNSWQSEEFNRIKFRIYGEGKGVSIKVGIPKIRVLDDLGYFTN